MQRILCHREHVQLQPCKGNESKSTCSRCSGGSGRPPPPPPFLRYAEPVRGEGGAASGPSPAWEFWAGKGGYSGEFIWQARMAPDLGGWKWRLFSAKQKGGSIWRLQRAGQFGKLISAGFLEKESKAIEKKSKACIVICRPVILHHIDTVYQGLKVMKICHCILFQKHGLYWQTIVLPLFVIVMNLM